MMSKPKYIVILTGLFFFCSVMAGGTSHFYSFFSVNILSRVDVLVKQHWPLAWQAEPRPKTTEEKLSCGSFCVFMVWWCFILEQTFMKRSLTV